jgi:hypothetical protein
MEIWEHEFTTKKQKTFDEKFYDRNGNAITKKQYEQILKEVQSNEPKFIAPEFPGGMNSFINYITASLKRNHSIQDQISYVKEISIIFYLDADGKPYDVKLSPEESMDFTRTILDAMKNMPRWKMNGLKYAGPMQRTIKFIF